MKLIRTVHGFVLKTNALTLSTIVGSTHPKISMEATVPIIYHSLNSTLNDLNKEEFKNLESTKKLLTIYDDVFQRYGHLKNTKAEKKNSFIVFEGLDGSGKTTISRKIAEKYNVSKLVTPPDCLRDIRSLFDDHLLRTAFYSLGNYIGELEVLRDLQKGPVILDRYWHSTAAFALAQGVENAQILALPPRGDETYVWPSDLLKPDVIVLLSVSEKMRLRRHRRRNTTNTKQEQLLKTSEIFRKNVIKAYENMENPNVLFIDGDGTVEEVVDLVLKKINYLL